jgi:GH15 family glucan-1,4-alpha-glucosidase
MKNLDYGVVGNCKSAALVSKEGSIDWYCLPEFDSPSIFAKLLDDRRGGAFSVEVSDAYEITQRYVEDTNILATRFSNGRDAFEILDFMPRYKSDSGFYVSPPDLIRYVRHLSGEPTALFHFRPKLGYAEHETYTSVYDEYLKSFSAEGSYESVYLYTSFDKEQVALEKPCAIREDHFFLLSYNQKLTHCTTRMARLEMERTEVYWLNWLERTIEVDGYREEVKRSALVLKLLTFHQSGAILAAVTTSLPESPGEERNWDYRFCWIRDASMIVSVMTSIGHYNAARRFLNFVIDVIPFKDEKIQIMYGIRGEKELTEKELPWLSGFEDSRPVRIGNGAHSQKQNDIYGVLIDLIWQYFSLFGHTLANGEELWTIVRTLLRTVQHGWREKDKSIWELRSLEEHFTFSKVLCWVAMDRGVRIAELIGKQGYADHWRQIREEIRADIEENGWNERVGAYTQYYGSADTDAANLLMEPYGFLDPKDPRYIATVERTYEELSRDGLMYRYRTQDDFGTPKSSFTVCTFWMIRALHVTGYEERARAMLDQVLSYSNHLGLFSEDIGFEDKRLLGNFPQGYSHLALIDAVIAMTGSRLNDTQKKLSMLRYPFG